ncbi:MAG: 1-deoxy-D-xylulose-5-phosphate reductoisomerase [Firmicutes bacterium]|nr:1-deoxy-D-xylulose-5-phosphate reductoisomerase [Bacillota bacterium]
MVNSISVLGSTGSVGRQTLEAAARLRVKILALAARSNISLLEEQARRFHPHLAAVYDETAAKTLRIALGDTDTRVVSGEGGLLEAACIAGADAVCAAVSGAVGLLPTLAAITLGRRICLANKETLVCAGALVTAAAREHGAEILPVDSEHSAIFQCLQGKSRDELRRILLTASGGPFLGRSREQCAAVTPEMAVRHPNWSMGAKISVDSATMMNKGLEFIEAMHLFGVAPEQIEVLIHPESVVHSMVEFVDGSVLAQCAVPDMALPIQYALTYPARLSSQTARLDFNAFAALHFSAPDLAAMPCLALAMELARRGGNLPCAMSAANEAAVALFLAGKIGYNAIYDRVAAACQRIEFTETPTLENILDTDERARELVYAM